MHFTQMTIELAEHLQLLQSQIEALRKSILNQPTAPSLEQLDRKLFALESQIRMGEEFRLQSDEFQQLIQAQDDPAMLLQLLHDRVLYAQPIPE